MDEYLNKMDDDMNEFMNLAKDPNLIQGIHNYCNKWCERCAYTSHCLVYKTIHYYKSNDKELKNEDIETHKSLEIINKTLNFTMKLLHEKITELGITLNENEINDDEELKKEKELNESPLILMSYKYSSLVDEWFNKFLNDEFLELKKKEWKIKEMTNSFNIDPKEETKIIKEHLELLKKFKIMPYVKFQRAMEGKIFDYGSDSYDANGSAKVALIVCEDCITSWEYMMVYFEHGADDILSILSLLQKIIKEGKQQFPNAMDFIRPGFDE